MALFECVKSVLFMRQLLEDMGMPQTEPTVIHEDNKSAIIMTSQYPTQSNSRHMDRRYKWINEVIRNNSIILAYTPTGRQRADGLTKIAIGKGFKNSRIYLLGRDMLDDEELSDAGGGDKLNRSHANTSSISNSSDES